MKNLLFVLLLLAVPCPAHAQETPLQVVIDPVAQITLDRATATYQATQGLRFKLLAKKNKNESRVSFNFQRPKLLRLETQTTEGTSLLISDGTWSYLVEDNVLQEKSESPADFIGRLPGELGSGAGTFIPGMLEGRSPIAVLKESFNNVAMPNLKLTIVAPPPAVMQGDVWEGVRVNVSTAKTKAAPRVAVGVFYLWFSREGLLRRLSVNTLPKEGARAVQLMEQVSEQQINPTFAPGTFTFDESAPI